MEECETGDVGWVHQVQHQGAKEEGARNMTLQAAEGLYRHTDSVVAELECAENEGKKVPLNRQSKSKVGKMESEAGKGCEPQELATFLDEEERRRNDEKEHPNTKGDKGITPIVHEGCHVPEWSTPKRQEFRSRKSWRTPAETTRP